LEHLLLNSSQSLSEEEKLEIVKGIARGMLHLHNHKIVHRDLAARNILLSEIRVPKISVCDLSFFFCLMTIALCILSFSFS
jgi:serine/threonine protein kinase